MSREAKQNNRNQASVEVARHGDAALVSVSGLVDERFAGFGNIGNAKAVVIDLSGLTRLTSFGVRQWLNALEALPKQATYLLACPTFFVDQLNMVLNFGGNATVLTVMAPYSCSSCGIESGEIIDVLKEPASLAKGRLPELKCSKCGGKLEFDETPESYFSFVAKYTTGTVSPEAAAMLSKLNLYTATESETDPPPRITKLVHGAVTYFRIAGTIGSSFRARPIVVGAEGEVVLDLSEIKDFEAGGQKEWRRLVKSLGAQVTSVTLVDVSESFLLSVADTMTMARNVAVASLLVPYRCQECDRVAPESIALDGTWPIHFHPLVCSNCGGVTTCQIDATTVAPVQKASTSVPAASAKLVAQRDEVLSRALTDAHVAQAGDGATPDLATDATILGKYQIVRPLSAGGMAEVFLAKQVGLEKHVALKRIQRKLLSARQQAIELFLNEAKIAGRLTHPNIVQVLDVGEAAGALYLAMEYVNGKDLRTVGRKLLKVGEMMPLPDACFVTREIAVALHHAYWSNDLNGKRLNVVHRDVSPHNVMLGFDGTVKLLDFGVATSAVTEHDEAVVVGKWMYMAPEAFTNQTVDHRSDLFSLGVMLYMLCTGAMPFTGREPKQIVKKIRAGEYKPVREIAAHVPERLANLVSRLLSASPDQRPQRGQDVAGELADIARENGWVMSDTGVINLMNRLYPDDSTTGANVEMPMIEIVLEEAVSNERSPTSFTPTSSRMSAIDISRTFRRSVEIKATSSGAVEVVQAPSPSGPTGIPPKATANPPKGTPWKNIAFVALFLALAGLGAFFMLH